MDNLGDEEDGRIKGWVRVREVSPILSPVNPVDEVRLVPVLVVAVRDRSRGTRESGVAVRGEVRVHVGRVAVVDVRERGVGAVDRIVERRLGTVMVRGVVLIRGVTLDRVVIRARDVDAGETVRRIVAEARERDAVEGRGAVRDLEGVIERTDLVEEGRRVDREREETRRARLGAAVLPCSLLPLEVLLRLRV